jgi:meso-butanediol dehydrogenase / (S,S)-butanediol dehydrogenase / diacetyl reductase
MGIYKDLEGKRVVITGGADGIGFATAKRFIDEGALVVIFDLDREKSATLTEKLPGLKGSVVVDVSSPEAVPLAFEKVDEIMGGIDVLISNAGISVRNKFTEIEYSQWDKVMRVNLDGMFLCAKEAVVRMKRQQSGVVLFTGSTNGVEGHPYYADYNSSKAGVIMMAKTLALECAPWLRANAICPGYVATPMQKAEYTPEMLKKVNEGIPMKRHAEPEEIAALFAFLASSQASYITGDAIAIDGGETAGLFTAVGD